MTSPVRKPLHLSARGVLFAFSRVKWLQMQLKKRYPMLLGLPIMGPYVQFYRQDGAFKTELSLYNFYSTFLPKTKTDLTYRVVAYDRNGGHIGSGKVTLMHSQSVTVGLETVIGNALDEYGLFHVQAYAKSEDPSALAAIGPTTGQFMTLYIPTCEIGATQFIHSHKLFQSIPIPYSPYTRGTGFTDDFSGQLKCDFFFLNPCLSATNVSLNVLDAVSGEIVATRHYQVDKRGVGRISLSADELQSTSGQFNFTYTFDRRISHMKPIIFRHHVDGVITCNHT